MKTANPTRRFFMNRYALTRLFFLIVPLCLLFSACSESSDDGGSGEEDSLGGSPIKTTVYANYARYYSLATGTEVKGGAIASKAWDIAFPNAREIRTNSGASAANAEGGANSGGQGGVWHTNKTDFDSVTLADKIEGVDPIDSFDYSFLNTDNRLWLYGMNAQAQFIVHQKNFNVMSYAGYDNENDPGVGEDESKPYSDGMFYLYDKKNFYKNHPTPSTMPPNFIATNQVYIVRHGDGVSHSKIQVTRYVRAYPKETYEVRYAPLP
jgi:hypothetical protein